MLSLLGKRLLQLIPTLFFVSVIIFSLQQLLPGDPALIMAGEERDPAVIEQICQQYHLDRPIPVQYLYWYRACYPAIFGSRCGFTCRCLISFSKVAGNDPARLDGNRDCAGDRDRRRNYIGRQENTALDYAAARLRSGKYSSRRTSGSNDADLSVFREEWARRRVGLRAAHRGLGGQVLRLPIMPAFVLGNSIAAVLMRHTRSAMLQVLESDYVRTARAKGLFERTVILNTLCAMRSPPSSPWARLIRTLLSAPC